MSAYIIPSEIIPVMKVTLCEVPQSVEMIMTMTGLRPFQIMEQLNFADIDSDDPLDICQTDLLKRIIGAPEFSMGQYVHIAKKYPNAIIQEINELLMEDVLSSGIKIIMASFGNFSKAIIKNILKTDHSSERKLEIIAAVFGA